MEINIRIADRNVGNGFPCFIIAEAGVNHNGNLDIALKMVDRAADAGADAIKFQTFKADLVASHTAPKASYQKESVDTGESQLELLRRLELPFVDFCKIQDHCHHKGIIFLSTPFDEVSAHFLNEREVPAFKIPSGEITNHPFLELIAKKEKPIILSTGMSSISEVDEAVQVIASAGKSPLALLHCVSNYPAKPSDVNLRAMRTLQTAFCVPVGYSDHSMGTEITLAAVALGASLVEKHFTLDRNLPGPDHRASLDADELSYLVTAARSVEAALGDGRKVPAASELGNRQVVRRSLVTKRDFAQGECIKPDMIQALRPTGGIPPNFAKFVIGRKVARSIKRGTPLYWQDLE